MVPALEKWLQARVESRAAKDMTRALVPTPADISLDLSHNDYLDLRNDAAFQDACRAAVRDVPAGAGASRLLGGEHPIFKKFEEAAARWKQAPSCLYIPSGFAANESLCSTLADASVAFFSDEWNHASIVDGLRLGRRRGAQLHIFKHSDLCHLESLLSHCTVPVRFIVMESLYSMDGDKAPLKELIALAEKYEATLIVDEAHAAGVYGPEGRGLLANTSFDHAKHISLTTFGKAFSLQGAAVFGPTLLREELINSARPFIYSTGPSPWVVAGCERSLELVSQMDAARSRLQKMSHWLRTELRNASLDIGSTDSHIIPIMASGNVQALALSGMLREHGIVGKAIRAPTVPAGSERVRLSLHAGVSDNQVQQVLSLLLHWKQRV